MTNDPVIETNAGGSWSRDGRKADDDRGVLQGKPLAI